jgi:hypothetical protein
VPHINIASFYNGLLKSNLRNQQEIMMTQKLVAAAGALAVAAVVLTTML